MSYDAPGFLDDLGQGEKDQWSDWISQQIDAAAAGDPQSFDFDAPRPRFFNALSSPAAADAVEKDITWSAFPRIVQLDSGTDEERWRTADSTRDVQDEYCEWSVTRRGDGKITRVTFTCEGPEYWTFLAATNPAKALEIYQKEVSSSVHAQDLLSGGRYNPRNKWNNSTSRGAMHLIQPNNTLSAEIELAAGASNTRAPKGHILTDPQQLIRCGAYGQAERHSDPTIGAEVNTLARADADITLANPVGIYFAGLSTAGWAAPDGSDPSSFWRYTRGTPQKPVRAVYEVTGDKAFVVGDIKINGRAIAYGGQIADFITMKLTGVATRLGHSKHDPLKGCRQAHQGLAGLAAPDVAAILGAPAFSTR